MIAGIKLGHTQGVMVMTATFRSRLDAISNAQAAHRETYFQKESETLLSRISLLDRFYDLRRDVIRSKMNEFSNHFADRKLDCRVIDDDTLNDEFGRRMYRAGITLRVYKGASLRDTLPMIPHYSVLWDDVNSVIRFHRNNVTRNLAGEMRYDGRASVFEVTSDLVEKKLLSFADWILNENTDQQAVAVSH